MWVTLNDEGRKVWGEVFPDGKVPVCSMNFQEVNINGKMMWVCMVNWLVLSEKTKIQITLKIAILSGASEMDVWDEIAKFGLPLRKSYTTGVIAEELRFFI